MKWRELFKPVKKPEKRESEVRDKRDEQMRERLDRQFSETMRILKNERNHT